MCGFGALRPDLGTAARSYASSLRRSWVREQLPAQEAQSLG
jgi:hypothetical protein